MATHTIDAFVPQAQDYLKGIAPLPVLHVHSSQAPDGLERAVTVAFSPGLLRDILKHPHEFKKDFTALNYGYVGSTNGGKNGIVPLRGQDVRLLRAVAPYLKEGMEPVKVVVHRKNGDRMVGVRDVNTNLITFVDRVSYKL